MKRIAILGSTGSIGKNAVDIALRYPERFRVVALAAKSQMQELSQQMKLLKPEVVAVGSVEARQELLHLLQGSGYKGEILVGDLKSLAQLPSADLILIALVGSQGLVPLMAGIAAGKDIAFVNKEALVMGGALVMEAVKKHGVNFIPVDSEHSAIFQCLLGEQSHEVEKIVITSSGGPFRCFSADQMKTVTPQQAIKHPRWNMGPKISVDSATLMNKGLEIIEARWLFDMDESKIDVIIHPQSIVHSLVEFCDGSQKSLMGVTDMRLAILYGLSYPERYALGIEKLNLAKVQELTFEPLDHKKFPSIGLCREACRLGGSYPAVVNAANEVAVEAFLKGQIAFLDILHVVEAVLQGHKGLRNYQLEEIMTVDDWARTVASDWVKKLSSIGVAQ